MININVVIASDHAGYTLKEYIKCNLDVGCLNDLGTDSINSVDYPDYANKLAEFISFNKSYKGILICGSGIGISIAANRHRHIRAALCYNKDTAKLSRLHNDANVLVLGARELANQDAMDIIKIFLSTEFEAGRHSNRVKKLS